MLHRILYGRRKFTIALLALALTFTLALLRIVAGGEWVTAVGLIVGLYAGAEMGETVFRNGEGEHDD